MAIIKVKDWIQNKNKQFETFVFKGEVYAERLSDNYVFKDGLIEDYEGNEIWIHSFYPDMIHVEISTDDEDNKIVEMIEMDPIFGWHPLDFQEYIKRKQKS